MCDARGRRPAVGILLALSLAAAVPAAEARARVAIALLPPVPLIAAPPGSVEPWVFPGYVPPALRPPLPAPFASTAPPASYFTPPLAVPVIVPGSGHAGGRH